MTGHPLSGERAGTSAASISSRHRPLVFHIFDDAHYAAERDQHGRDPRDYADLQVLRLGPDMAGHLGQRWGAVLLPHR